MLRPRRVDPKGRSLVRQLGIERISKSRVSEMARELDAAVEAFRSRPLDGGPYTYVWLDALTQKVREAGRIVNVACVVATGVNAQGNREILGTDLFTAEDGAAWTAFLRGLVPRGLSGVRLVVPDAHPGLVDAIASALPGASWQRCRTHFMRNLLAKVPKSAGHRAVRRALVRGVNSVHVVWSSVGVAVRRQMRNEMLRFRTVYSTNYDLLVYWAVIDRPPC